MGNANEYKLSCYCYAASFVFIVLNKIYSPFTLLWVAKVLLIL